MKYKIISITDEPLNLIVESENGVIKTIPLKNGEIASSASLTTSMRVYHRKQMVKLIEVEEVVSKAETKVETKVETKTEIKAETKADVLNTIGPENINKAIKQAEKETQIYIKEKEVNGEGEKVGVWTEEEEIYIRRYYPTKGGKFVAEKLQRSYKSVQKKVARLKLKKKKKKNKK